MRVSSLKLALAVVFVTASATFGQINFNTPNPAVNSTGEQVMFQNGAGLSVPAGTGAPLPVTGGIIVAIPGSPPGPQAGPNVVTIQGVAGMVPVATYSGSCPPNPITKVSNAWPFCK